MELYEVTSNMERALRNKADKAHVPFGGSLELLPLCNMNCKMCYVRKSREEMEKEGRMLSCDEWLAIAEQAKELGTLNLLLTGGEPLLYPEFKRLYTSLRKMGFIIMINTNGTLIDEAWADFFAKNPCRRFNITLYGKDNDTYGELCRNPKGFSRVMQAAKLFKERHIPFRFTCSITSDNVDDLPELFDIAKRFEVPLQPATYMFPALRREISADRQERLSPEKAAQAMFQSYLYQKSEDDMGAAVRSTLASLAYAPRVACVNGQGYTCHSGRSGFWLNWKGEMLPCGMLDQPKYNLLEQDFKTCWEQLVQDTSKVTYCEDCVSCKLQNICRVCPACLIAETGSTMIRPEYVCRYTEELVRLQMEYLPAEARAPFRNLLENGLKNLI